MSRYNCLVCLYPNLTENSSLFDVISTDIFAKIFVHVPQGANFNFSDIKRLDVRIEILPNSYNTIRGYFLQAILGNVEFIDIPTNEYLVLLAANCRIGNVHQNILVKRRVLAQKIRFQKRTIRSFITVLGLFHFAHYWIYHGRVVKCQHEGLIFSKDDIDVIRKSFTRIVYMYFHKNFSKFQKIMVPFGFEEYFFSNIFDSDSSELETCCEVFWDGNIPAEAGKPLTFHKVVRRF